MRGIRLSMPELDPVLDGSERSLVERALAWLRPHRPRESAALWSQVKRVAMLGGLLDQTPSPQLPSMLGGVVRDEASLVAELSRLDPMGGDLPLPERAQVARAFLLTKITLLRDFVTALGPTATTTDVPRSSDVAVDPELRTEIRDELAQSIYTLIATEILAGLLGEADTSAATKGCAARQLILVWDRAVQLEIDEFCPLLESVWRARSKIGVHFGALLGAGEFLRLVQEDCPPEFLDFFVRDEVSAAERDAFQEFLFNVPHEDLVTLRAAMEREGLRVVDRTAASRILGRPLDEAVAVDDPEALYRSYRRRRTAAEYRQLTGAPGPRRTAEAYMMVYVLALAAGPGAAKADQA